MLKPIEPRDSSPGEKARFAADKADVEANPERWGGGSYDRFMQVNAPRETESATVLALRGELDALKTRLDLKEGTKKAS